MYVWVQILPCVHRWFLASYFTFPGLSVLLCETETCCGLNFFCPVGYVECLVSVMLSGDGLWGEIRVKGGKPSASQEKGSHEELNHPWWACTLHSGLDFLELWEKCTVVLFKLPCVWHFVMAAWAAVTALTALPLPLGTVTWGKWNVLPKSFRTVS